jgi:hypothetical protein
MIYQEIERAVAYAIHDKLDIVEALPAIYDIPPERLEDAVENYVLELQYIMSHAIENEGQGLIESGDAYGLMSLFMRKGARVPPSQLFTLSEQIIQEMKVRVIWRGDFPNMKRPKAETVGGVPITIYPGQSFWYLKTDL